MAVLNAVCNQTTGEYRLLPVVADGLGESNNAGHVSGYDASRSWEALVLGRYLYIFRILNSESKHTDSVKNINEKIKLIS